MERSKTRNQKTRHRLGTMVAALAILFVLAGNIQVADAKTQITFAGSPAIRYNPYEIPTLVKPYIWYVEYDLLHSPGTGFGVRLYLTEEGKNTLKNGGTPLAYVTSYVMSNPEWYQERSPASVGTEIWYHANWRITEVNIQYHYEDLGYRETLLYGKI